MAYIHAYDLGSAVLQQAIGKAAGGLTHIQAAQTCHVQPCGFQRTFQLQTAARNVFGFGVVKHFNFSSVGNFIAVFSHTLPGCSNLYLINQHPPLHTRANQALGLGACGGKAVFNKEYVRAHRGFSAIFRRRQGHSEWAENKARVSGNRSALQVHEDCLIRTRNAVTGSRSSR